MALRALIVDDESLARSRLRTLLGECRTPAARVAGEAANASDAMALLTHQSFDLVLLDIHLPGADGIQLAEALRQLPAPPPVVFVTAHAAHAVKAFEIEAVDYLTKPVRAERLQAALQKVERLAVLAPPAVDQPDGRQWLVVTGHGRTLRVPVDDVHYLRSELKYVSVRTAQATYLVDESLSQLEARFPERFLRIHRSVLVARAAVRALVRHHDPQEGEGWAVELAGSSERLAVSRRQLALVRTLLGE